MDSQNLSAPSCVQPRVPRGVTHINVRHSTRFTVVGNHLAQHRELTLTAIGLALHIQSLPEGARVDIKSLAARLPEGEARIASALRQLEAHGYLSRRRERLPSGRVVTHTVSYNRPQGLVEPAAQPAASVPTSAPIPVAEPVQAAGLVATTGLVAAPELPPVPGPVHESALTPVPRPSSPSGPAPAPAPARNFTCVSPVPQASTSAATPMPKPEPAPAPAPAPAPKPRLPLPALDTDTDTDNPDRHRHRAATALLASLHREDPRLLLAERDVHRLAPAVTAWLERGAAAEAVRLALTAGLPRARLHHPASLLAHCLTELLPPRLPAAAPPIARSHPQHSPPHPLQNCEGCDRAFRAAAPGRCRDCRSVPQEAA
ncbi:helix-turn-helix domain-containing protein [Streptomyces sp. NBC_00645]|uniref:helix-turn-helix domain-containing protein n=1 Tax=Streptomyces sp. NBC_00645 TaxID=2975795 RepID=UPI0032432456